MGSSYSTLFSFLQLPLWGISLRLFLLHASSMANIYNPSKLMRSSSSVISASSVCAEGLSAPCMAGALGATMVDDVGTCQGLTTPAYPWLGHGFLGFLKQRLGLVLLDFSGELQALQSCYEWNMFQVPWIHWILCILPFGGDFVNTSSSLVASPFSDHLGEVS